MVLLQLRVGTWSGRRLKRKAALRRHWSAKHDKELDFAQKKLKTREAQACRERLLIAAENSEELETSAAQQIDQIVAGVHSRQNASRKRDREMCCTCPDKHAFRGQAAFVEHAAWANDLQSWSLGRAEQMLAADVMIMQNPGTQNPASKVLWVAVLCGLMCFSDTLLKTGSGSCVKYQAALGTKRLVYVTDLFKERHSAIFELVTSCHARLGRQSKWRFIDRAEFVRAQCGQNFKYAVCTGQEKQERNDF